MKRANILQDYIIDEQGVIVSDGEFRGMPLWTPYLLESLEDQIPEEGEHITKAIINVRDREEFPELKDVASVEIHTRWGEFYRLGRIERRMVRSP